MDNEEMMQSVQDYTDSKESTEIVSDCYTEMSKYVTRTRAYASATDGLKSVYRRVIYASRGYRKKVKSAAIVGDAIKLHPHGDSSIYGALIEMACEFGLFPLYDKKGNFGGQGQGAAAMRYTEACLSDIARLMYLELIDYAEMIDGEAGYPEPKYLPALLPYCLLTGTTGIPVGMPLPNVVPLNALELTDYYIDTLEGRTPKIPLPDLGEVILDCGREDVIEPLVKQGKGKLWYKGLIIQEDANKFVVTSETPKCNFWKLRSKVEHWIDEDVLDYIDETDGNGDRHVFIITNPSKLSANDLKNTLDRALKCSVSYNFILEDNERAVYCGIDYIVDKNLKYLRQCTVRKYQDMYQKSDSRLKVLRAIEDFKKTGKIKVIDELSEEEVVEIIVGLGYEEWVGKAVLDKPTRYLTKSHLGEIYDLENELNNYQGFINNPDTYLIGLYRELREKLIPIYNKRGHSIPLADLSNVKPKYARLDVENQKLIISENPEDGITFNRVLYLVSDDGNITSKYVSSRIATEIDISSEYHKFSHVASDKGKYLVAVIDRNIFVKKLEELIGDRDRFKIWDGCKVDSVHSIYSERILITDERNDTAEVTLQDYERSRISYPNRVTKYAIRGVKELS